MSEALTQLEADVRADLARIAHPGAAWLEPKTGPDGNPALDVLIIGAGQSGIAIGFGLMRSRVSNILLIDKAEEGKEGPWLTYARMPTLRSPKDYTGPDLDIPSLTYQSWHEARFGKESWQALDLIPRAHWAEYLIWLRRTIGLPVCNGCELLEIAPAADGLLAARVKHAEGTETLYARKIVLATGQEGMGGWMIPEQLAHLPASSVATVADDIDFEGLRGKRVAVIGAGASAFDNAATALEAGAAEVHLLCRRTQIQVIQPYRWLTFRGFLRHLSDLDDAWRWRFMRKVLEMREGFPQPTYDRCARHANFTLHEGAPIEAARETGKAIELQTPRGAIIADFVICGAGIDMNFAGRGELSRFAGNIATWADRYQPPEGERNERLGRFPYLADDYAFTERVPGKTPWISDIHLFAIASTMSFGASGSSINAMTTAVPKLVNGLTRGLFRADVERHWASLSAYDVPQAVVARPARKMEEQR
ncbi:cation diffusion facilitator CzcD-associated flavoprotein CzcO [Bradyrhizobium sp. R2.2-H]|jgi:cation diffusion facilitator CzcD-associated flavoprotein CzcO|uniref:NAD(P)-binding domain-containing protein n=1 Tax=unclassified Bradyrhizobium TaxID=2631580 RepID=UPI00105004A8|nr:MULTISPECIES: NAD(P)/FAD-dependent oxidoreductase [unclassified Bradyrhizobium]TCU71316.1 cation diffusion facilitator CzcD-associated flavoprotein CzcO [Bradyrhizobium sp. Y-H1]TCU73165.1 cation diffusion facilitator CzcD-associated flavoprotein CzcO [Bradyrhizobium sp. R2.2-H]